MISEYDAFGPWIYEVTPEHPLPPLFVSFVPEAEPLMLFKIPRNIERRVATPDMDLYDYVVGAYEDHICVLKRVDHSVEAFSVAYADIEGIRLFRHFLHGVLTLYQKDGIVEIPFNTVSIDIVSRFTELIRQRYPSKPVALLPEAGSPNNMDILFVNLLRDLQKEEPDIQSRAYQAVQSPKLLDSCSALQKLLFRFRPQKLPALLYLTTPTELIVILRESPSKKEAGDAYTYHYTYLPLANIRNIRISESERFQGITDCNLETSHNSISYSVDSQNQGVLSFLRSL